VPSVEASQHSQPSPNTSKPIVENKDTEQERRLLQSAYWSNSLWHCKDCKFSYDRPGMIDHIRLKHNQQPQQQPQSQQNTEGRG
jgi:hypothetical protein